MSYNFSQNSSYCSLGNLRVMLLFEQKSRAPFRGGRYLQYLFLVFFCIINFDFDFDLKMRKQVLV